jgi:hypothetical protein
MRRRAVPRGRELQDGEPDVKPRQCHRAIVRDDVPPERPIDLTVHRRIGGARLRRNLARAAQAVVEVLGKRRRVWFAYEELLARITDRRQAAYFDHGVEHGIAAAAANGLTNATKTQRAIAERIVRDVIRTGVARDDAIRAAVLAVWGLLGRSSAPRRSTGR